MAKTCTQMSIEVADQVGKLAEVTDKLKDAGINILAMCAWTQDGRGHLQMIVDDANKACAALEGAVDRCDCGEILTADVPNQLGALNEMSKKLGKAGISIESIYCTAGEAAQAMLVFNTSDNAKAAGIV